MSDAATLTYSRSSSRGLGKLRPSDWRTSGLTAVSALLSGAGARRREHRHRPGRADEGGERRVTDVQDDVGSSQGISGHLACLKDCGLVADRPEGRAEWYRIAEPEVISVIRSAEGLLSRTGEKVELCPNYRPRPPR